MSRIGFPVGRNYKRGSENPKKWENPKILKNLGVPKIQKIRNSKKVQKMGSKNEGSEKS